MSTPSGIEKRIEKISRLNLNHKLKSCLKRSRFCFRTRVNSILKILNIVGIMKHLLLKQSSFDNFANVRRKTWTTVLDVHIQVFKYGALPDTALLTLVLILAN